MTAATNQAQVIDSGESFGAMLDHAWHILPFVLGLTLPVMLAGVALLYLVRKDSLATSLTVLVLIPIAATVAGVIGVSGLMFNATLTTMLLVCLLVALVTVPGRDPARPADRAPQRVGAGSAGAGARRRGLPA